jgi:hypothetical protein
VVDLRRRHFVRKAWKETRKASWRMWYFIRTVNKERHLMRRDTVGQRSFKVEEVM